VLEAWHLAEVHGTESHHLHPRAAKFGEEVGLLARDLASDTGPEAHNDVVLDKIVEINLVDVAKFPRSTTSPSPPHPNFARQWPPRSATPETGYIQRRLIKALEDCKVSHDSVRNASGGAVQFKYGDDGMDVPIEAQTIPTYSPAASAEMARDFQG
jgi:hypothetical protein